MVEKLAAKPFLGYVASNLPEWPRRWRRERSGHLGFESVSYSVFRALHGLARLRL